MEYDKELIAHKLPTAAMMPSTTKLCRRAPTVSGVKV